MKLTFTTLLFLLGPGTLLAQHGLSGTVADDSSMVLLSGASLLNISNGKTAISDSHGAFSINCREGDTLRFSMVGYLPQQLIISKELFTLPTLRIRMKQGVITLQQQLVRGSNHYKDSLRLREEYAAYFRKKQGWKMNLMLPPDSKQELRDQFHTVRQGFNINQFYKNLSFRNNRRKERIRKQLLDKEAEAYINYAYDPGMVEQVTGLKGDSLDYFMAHYRPAASVWQSSNTYEKLSYIKQLFQRYTDSLGGVLPAQR